MVEKIMVPSFEFRFSWLLAVSCAWIWSFADWKLTFLVGGSLVGWIVRWHQKCNEWQSWSKCCWMATMLQSWVSSTSWWHFARCQSGERFLIYLKACWSNCLSKVCLQYRNYICIRMIWLRRLGFHDVDNWGFAKYHGR